jgi:hypothetical protein
MSRSAGFFIGIDLHETAIPICVVDHSGEFVYKRRFDVPMRRHSRTLFATAGACTWAGFRGRWRESASAGRCCSAAAVPALRRTHAHRRLHLGPSVIEQMRTHIGEPA